MRGDDCVKPVTDQPSDWLRRLFDTAERGKGDPDLYEFPMGTGPVYKISAAATLRPSASKTL